MPRVSLLLVVKDGMPYLPAAIESVRAQTFRDFEVVVQDGQSTDGSLELLNGVDSLSGWEVLSEPDTGIGDAYNRAFCRSGGEIVGSIDSDNILEPDALEHAVCFLSEHPDAAAAYGGSNLLSADGTIVRSWMPGEFDLLRLLNCELVPPFAVSFFDRTVCGNELRFDESLKTCADFDLWLRLSHLPISRIPFILGGTRLSEASMTRRSETYDNYIVDKQTAIDGYLSQLHASPLVEAIRAHALAGLHLWAAESVYDIQGRRTDQFERYLAAAAELDPGGERLGRASSQPDFDPSRLPPGEGQHQNGSMTEPNHSPLAGG